MLKSWKLGSAFGIGIYVHWSFLLLPAWVLLSNLELGGLAVALFAVAVVLAVFGCVVLHELGHAAAARRFGIPTRDITLYPIGGVARLERMSERPGEEFWIAVAGPAVNLAIAGLLYGFFAFSGTLTQLVPLPLLGLTFLWQLMVINLVLFVFNLLPAFPMDGGRVLRSLLALRMGHLRATQVAVNVGVIMAVLMGLVGTLYFHSLSLLLVAAFVYFAGQQELAAVYHREAQRWARPFGFYPEEELARQQGFRPDEEPQRPSPPVNPQGAVYLWDPRLGVWVEQKPIRPVRRYRFEAD